VKRLAFAPIPQVLTRHSQRSIELARGVLPGDRRREFDEFIIAELFAETFEQLIPDVAIAERHRVGVFQREPLAITEQIAPFPVFDRFEFGVVVSQLAADRSLQIGSELAAIEQRYSPVDQHR
jgi:hypothetical protein